MWDLFANIKYMFLTKLEHDSLFFLSTSLSFILFSTTPTIVKGLYCIVVKKKKPMCVKTQMEGRGDTQKMNLLWSP